MELLSTIAIFSEQLERISVVMDLQMAWVALLGTLLVKIIYTSCELY